MERLTEWTGEEWIAVQKSVPAPGKKHGRIIGSRDCMARLAAYEDTGMGPKDIEVLRNNYKALSQSCNEMIDRIDDLYSEGEISDIYTIEHCPFCGAEKETLEYDAEHCAVTCNECGRNFRVRENLY